MRHASVRVTIEGRVAGQRVTVDLAAIALVKSALLHRSRLRSRKSVEATGFIRQIQRRRSREEFCPCTPYSASRGEVAETVVETEDI
jgi:hypothetical protein